MADTKITALAAIATVDPAADVLPIVDISDTSMAASGTTKKITTNQILGAGGTATLASATITGAATVGTTLGVTGVSTLASATITGAATVGTTLAVTGNLTAAADSILGTGSKATDTLLDFKADTGTQRIYLDRGGRNLIFKDVTTNIENYRITGVTGVQTWGVGGSTAMTLNSTGLGVKGTVGTASGDAVIAFGTRGVIVGNAGSAIASASYIDVTVITSGAGYQGFLSVANTQDAGANTRTQTTFSVFGRGTSSTITQIATENGSVAGASFTVTTPSNGVIRITNTSGLTTSISAQFFGGTSA